MSIKETELVYNAIQTPDGTILESKTRHDYKSYEDANGKTYIVDGGTDYMRTSTHSDQINLSVVYGDGHDKVRNVLGWGTYGKDGTEPLHYITIGEMTTDHINAVIENVIGIKHVIKQVMLDELEQRLND